jgi:hypothetical protein
MLIGPIDSIDSREVLRCFPVAGIERKRALEVAAAAGDDVALRRVRCP